MYRLLIADKDENTCEIIKYLLDWSEYNISSVLTAASYTDAVNKAVDFRPHIALLGFGCRGGIYYSCELVSQLRAAGLQTIFCVMDEQQDFAYACNCLRAGARDYLLKPLDVRELRSFLERTVVQDLHGTLPRTSASSIGSDPVLHMEYARLSQITNKILLVVKSNYRSSLSLTGIAEELNMSSKYIGRVFLRDTGIKFSDYLTAYRMLQARRLIEGTQEKIAVVARQVGYSQLNNFYVHFKKYYHTSPSSLRNFDSDRAVLPLPMEGDHEDARLIAEEHEQLA